MSCEETIAALDEIHRGAVAEIDKYAEFTGPAAEALAIEQQIVRIFTSYRSGIRDLETCIEEVDR